MIELNGPVVKVHGRRRDKQQTEILSGTRENSRKNLEAIRESGELERQQKRVLFAFNGAWIIEAEGLTFHNVARLCNIAESSATGRINELRNLELVESVTDANGNVVRRDRCTLYRITSKGREALNSKSNNQLPQEERK